MNKYTCLCVCSTLYSLHLFFICFYNIIAASIRLRPLCLGCGSHTVMFSKETLSFFTSLRGNTAQALTAERWVFSEAQSFIHVHQMSALTLPWPFINTILEIMDGCESRHGDSTWTVLRERADFLMIWYSWKLNEAKQSLTNKFPNSYFHSDETFFHLVSDIICIFTQNTFFPVTCYRSMLMYI